MARPQGARAATAIEFAIALFAARPWPEKKLRERLLSRYEPAEAEAAIARMRELGMVDDAAWAEQFARDRFERTGKGRHRIRAELVARGIDSRSIDEALERTFTGDVERERAAAVLESMRAADARKDRSARHAQEHGQGHGQEHADRHADAHAADHAESRSADDGPDAREAAEARRIRLFRRMLARGYPAELVRDLLGVS